MKMLQKLITCLQKKSIRRYKMLISELKSQCKDKGKLFQKGKLFLIQQNLTQHSDFLTVSWLLHQLESEAKVALVAFRENYGHFLSLSKKIGKSIEPYIKSKQLRYYECFQSSLNCSQLPLTETSPNSFVLPPTSVNRIKRAQIMKKDDLFEQNSVVIVDAISFVESDMIFKIYQQAMDKNCKLILSGAMEGDQITKILRPETDVYIKLENDVGSHGKFKLISQNSELNIHWKHVQGKFELTQYVKI